MRIYCPRRKGGYARLVAFVMMLKGGVVMYRSFVVFTICLTTVGIPDTAHAQNDAFRDYSSSHKIRAGAKDPRPTGFGMSEAEKKRLEQKFQREDYRARMEKRRGSRLGEGRPSKGDHPEGGFLDWLLP